MNISDFLFTLHSLQKSIQDIIYNNYISDGSRYSLLVLIKNSKTNQI